MLASNSYWKNKKNNLLEAFSLHLLKLRRQRKLKYHKSFGKSFHRSFHEFTMSRSQKRKKWKVLLITSVRNINSNSYSHHFYGNPVLLQKQPSRVVPKKMGPKLFCKTHRKASLPESLFLIKLAVDDPQLYLKETPVQFFSFVYCEVFKNSYFTENTKVAASSLHRIFLFGTLDHLITSM